LGRGSGLESDIRAPRTRPRRSLGVRPIADASHSEDRGAELHRLAGELESDPARAEACFAQALAVARRQRAKAWELRAALGLGGLLRRLGRFDEARALVAAVLATFQEGFEAPDLRQARAFLATDRAA
jgi:hypothetical protein